MLSKKMKIKKRNAHIAENDATHERKSKTQIKCQKVTLDHHYHTKLITS